MGSTHISITYETDVRDRPLSVIRVRPAAGNPRRGWLTADGWTIPVALGRGGIMANKREGDGGTPRGIFHPRAIVVARRPPPATADLPAGPADPARGRLVRGPGRPPLQSADPAGTGPGRRPADARGSSLRFHRRDRSQHRAAHCRPRQRRVPASGAHQLFADRGMCFDDEIGHAAIIATDGSANPNRNWMKHISGRGSCSRRNQIVSASQTLHDHWRAGTKLDALDDWRSPAEPRRWLRHPGRDRALFDDASVRLEDRRHQRGRTEAHQCRRPDGRTHPGRDRDRRRRHGFDGRQRDARRRARIRLSHARRSAGALDALHACSRCSMRSTRCIPRSRFRIRALPISSAPARRSSSPTMPARICSCSARRQRRTGVRSISSRSGPSSRCAASNSSATARTCSAIPASR